MQSRQLTASLHRIPLSPPQHGGVELASELATPTLQTVTSAHFSDRGQEEVRRCEGRLIVCSMVYSAAWIEGKNVTGTK